MHRLARVAAVALAAPVITLGGLAAPALAYSPPAASAPDSTQALTAPTVSISPDPISNSTKGQVTVSGSAPGGATSVAISIGDGTSTAPVTATALVTNGTYAKSAIDVSSLADGTLTASVTSTDLSGNTSPAGTATVTKDTTAPVTTLVVPTYITTSTTTVSGDTDPGAIVVVKATDSGGPIPAAGTVSGQVKVPASGHWTLELDTSGLADGSISWTATPTDVAGNAGTAATATSTKDTVAPGAPTITAATAPYTTGTFTVAGKTAMADGQDALTVDVTVTDLAGHSITSPGQPVTAAANPLGTGSYSVPFGANQMSTLVDGTLTISALFHDAAGNAGPVTTATTEKGVLAVVSTSPADASSVKPPSTVSATFNQPLSSTGTGTTSTIAVKNAANTAIAGTTAISGDTITFTPTAALPDGVYTVTATGYDKKFTTESSTRTFTFTADSTAAPTAPIISAFTSPITAANQTTVVVSGTADLASTPVIVTIGTLTRTVDAGTDRAWTATFDVTALADGTLTASATQSDGTKTSTAGTATSTKDATAPAKTSSTPADGATVAPTSTVSITFGENLGTGSIQIPGVSGSSAVSGGTVTFTTDSPLADGAHTATATVTDVVGNPASATVTFTVDSTPATTSTVSLVASSASVVIGQSIVLSGRVAQGTPAAYGAVSLEATTTSGQTVPLGTATVASDGTYSLTLKPSVNATYRASYAGDGANTASVSTKRHTDVAAKVTASSATGKHTSKAVLRGTVKPGPTGQTVTIYEATKKGKVKLTTAKLTGAHTFSVKVSLPKGTTRLVAQVKATGDNTSGAVSFTAKRT